MTNQILEKSFTVSGTARLELNNIRGSVEIRPGADGVIMVKAEKLVNTGDAGQTEIKMTQKEDGTVKVDTRFPEDWLDVLFGSKPCKVNYVVTAPRVCALQINGVSSTILAEGIEGDASFKTVSGEMTMRSLKGSLSFDTVSGRLQLSDLAGRLRLNTVSGGIKGTQLTGALNLNTVSGDVGFERSSLPSVSANTVSGKVELETDLGEGPYRFNSVSGNLALKLPANARCTTELQSMSGGLTISLPASSITWKNGRQVADIQGGGVKVYLNSVSGNMEIGT